MADNSLLSDKIGLGLRNDSYLNIRSKCSHVCIRTALEKRYIQQLLDGIDYLMANLFLNNSKFYLLGLTTDKKSSVILEDVAKKHDFEYLSCHDSNSALEKIKEHRKSITIIICDHSDAIDGFQLCKHLMEKKEKIPVIVKISYLPLEDMDKITEYRIARVVSSYSQDKMLDLVQQVNRKDYLVEAERLKEIFVAEAVELMDDLEPLIMELEENPTNTNILNAIFRNVHTLKGSGNILEWREFSKFLHSFEDFLDKIKSGTLVINQIVVEILLLAYDRLKKIVSKLSQGELLEFDLKKWCNDFVNYKEKDSVKSEDSKETVAQSDKYALAISSTIKAPVSYIEQILDQNTRSSKIHSEMAKMLAKLQGKKNQEYKDGLVGELSRLEESIAEINKLATDLLKVPIKNIYRPFPRIVRNISKSLEKSVHLTLKGSHLWIDNRIAEVLNNSLIHLIRNSLDHGIEHPEERAKHGKEKQGTICIETALMEKSIVVKLIDDGKGIDFNAVSKRAIEKNIYSKKELKNMSEKEIAAIIFAPGFSTAESVSEISGRGVGMDTVKVWVESINGNIEINSQAGKGCTFQLEFPTGKPALFF